MPEETSLEPINELRKKEVLGFIQDSNADFSYFFKAYPKTIFSKECGLHTTSFVKKIDNPKNIRIDEVLRIANYFGLEPEYVCSLILKTIRIKDEKKTTGKRKKKE